jgi:hypothetical protein
MPRYLASRAATAALAAALGLMTASPALAAWPHTSGTNLAVCTAVQNQQSPVSISDGAGGIIVAWQDARSGGVNDVYAHHILASGSLDPAWPATGLAVSTAANHQMFPTIASDGAGGAIIAWVDYRSGTESDIYAHRVLAAGTVDPAWPANGRLLCNAGWDQSFAAAVSDGAGGAIVTWSDSRSGGGVSFDVYVHRVLASGAVDPTWSANGVLVSAGANDQSFPTIVSDGAGGAVITWQDGRAGNNDIYAHRVLAAGSVDTSWPTHGLAVCTATNSQERPNLVADGSGGAIITWRDLRVGTNYDVYAHHVQSGGQVDAGWPADGRALCTAAGNQIAPTIASDGNGGAIVTWSDGRPISSTDIYAQHVLLSGSVDGAWPVDGRAICTAANDQNTPVIIADGAGGALISWSDTRVGFLSRDIYSHHVLAAGAVDQAWPVDGRALCTAAGDQQLPLIVADGTGGAVVIWTDLRGATFDLYAQRVARHGVLGTPEPVIASVRDVPNDQGGKVKLSWDASWLDTDPSAVVDHYWIFRSVPPASAQAALRRGARLSGTPTRAPGHRELFATTDGVQTLYWEFVANQQAFHILSGYSYIATTTGDSTGAYNPPTMFMVTAWNAAATQYWSSVPAGGYSVDNLPPGTPEPFLGNYSGGATHLHWEPNAEADFAHYRLYRGSNAGFVPGPGTLVASPPDTGHADVGAAGSYYKLSAVDSHGNESGFALLTPGGTTAVGAAGGVELELAQPFPNPSRGEVTFAMSLAAEGRVSLAVFDAAGRRVRQVFAGTVPAGARAFTWDGRGESGQSLAGGLYFLRVEAGGRVMVRRFARVE